MTHDEAKTLTTAITSDYPEARVSPEMADGTVAGLRVRLYVPTGRNTTIGNDLYIRSTRDWDTHKSDIRTRRVSR